MLVAHNENQDRVLAREIDRTNGPFFCPVCCEPLRLHKGTLRVHHFAHMPNATCTYGIGESDAHRNAKEKIHLAFQAKGIVSILEAPLGDIRPDIMAIINGEIVGIEVQVSAISSDEITRRTLAYAKRGMSIAWVICDDIPAGDEPIRFQWRQRFLHGLYFGRVYYYDYCNMEDYVMPIHLNATYGYSPSHSEHFDDKWYRRKTVKWPLRASSISLSDTSVFHSMYRKSWAYTSGETQIIYPSSKIWIDNFPKWWDNE